MTWLQHSSCGLQKWEYRPDASESRIYAYDHKLLFLFLLVSCTVEYAHNIFKWTYFALYLTKGIIIIKIKFSCSFFSHKLYKRLGLGTKSSKSYQFKSNEVRELNVINFNKNTSFIFE